MSGVSLILDDETARAAIARAVAAGAEPQALLSDIGAYVLSRTQQRFEDHRAPGGAAWAPFAKRTLRSMRRARRANPQLLRDTNRLYASYTEAVVGDTSIVGTNLSYAAIHHAGGQITIPPREWAQSFKLAGLGKRRRLRFARASDRANSRHDRTVRHAGYTVTVPARPALGLDALDEVEIVAIAERHVAAALAAGGAP